MKIQAFNPFLPSYEYIPDAEAGCMSTEVMTGLTGKIFA